MSISKQSHAFGALIIFLLTSGMSGIALAEDADILEVADYLEMEQVRDAQISPDGRQIIYTRRWVDQKADRWASAVWIMDADGSRHRSLIEGGNARWSPSGDRILFIAQGDNEKPQLFVRWMNDEGAVSQVTRINITPTSPVWSPDGRQIAFVAIRCLVPDLLLGAECDVAKQIAVNRGQLPRFAASVQCK